MKCKNIYYGHGRSFASFGEIIQGRSLDNLDFLATLPINLWSNCKLTAKKTNGPLVVEAKKEWLKAKLLVELILKRIGIQKGYYILVEVDSEIPVGKGLSSSSADMLAALRAAQHLFGILISTDYISYLFNEIEPHDALHFDSSVLYNHRKGRLIKNYNYIPNYNIIYVDTGGTVDTINYNNEKKYSMDVIRRYEKIMNDLNQSFYNKDDCAIAKCATESFMVHINASKDKRSELNDFINEISAIGMQATHSGTCIGFLFKHEADITMLEYAKSMIEKKYMKKSFLIETLQLIE